MYHYLIISIRNAFLFKRILSLVIVLKVPYFENDNIKILGYEKFRFLLYEPAKVSPCCIILIVNMDDPHNGGPLKFFTPCLKDHSSRQPLMLGSVFQGFTDWHKKEELNCSVGERISATLQLTFKANTHVEEGRTSWKRLLEHSP